MFLCLLLPPAYVVRREGNSFPLLVCPHLGGGYPYPIMLCNISQNAMGQQGGTLPGPAGGGCPGRGGTLPGGVPCQGVTLPGGTLPGGVSCWGGTLPGGYPTWVPPPPARSGWGEGVPSKDNRRSIHYTAGGMPLPFTQEDFLVCSLVLALTVPLFHSAWLSFLSSFSPQELLLCLVCKTVLSSVQN